MENGDEPPGGIVTFVVRPYMINLLVSLPILMWSMLPVVKSKDEGVRVDLRYVKETPEICEYFQHPGD